MGTGQECLHLHSIIMGHHFARMNSTVAAEISNDSAPKMNATAMVRLVVIAWLPPT